MNLTFNNLTAVNIYFYSFTTIKTIKILDFMTEKLTKLTFNNLTAVNIYFYIFTTIKTFKILDFLREKP
jgi:hypothetical protein